jgi:hypothetical protein
MTHEYKLTEADCTNTPPDVVEPDGYGWGLVTFTVDPIYSRILWLWARSRDIAEAEARRCPAEYAFRDFVFHPLPVCGNEMGVGGYTCIKPRGHEGDHGASDGTKWTE